MRGSPLRIFFMPEFFNYFIPEVGFIENKKSYF